MDTIAKDFIMMVYDDPKILTDDLAYTVKQAELVRDFAVRSLLWLDVYISTDSTNDARQALDDMLDVLPEKFKELAIKRFDDFGDEEISS